MVNHFILSFVENKFTKLKSLIKFRKFKRTKFRFGDIIVILGIFTLPIIPVTIVKNLYMDFWKFTHDLRDFYRSWLLFVRTNFKIKKTF